MSVAEEQFGEGEGARWADFARACACKHSAALSSYNTLTVVVALVEQGVDLGGQTARCVRSGGRGFFFFLRECRGSSSAHVANRAHMRARERSPSPRRVEERMREKAFAFASTR